MYRTGSVVLPQNRLYNATAYEKVHAVERRRYAFAYLRFSFVTLTGDPMA
jgi:hypothetical protein